VTLLPRITEILPSDDLAALLLGNCVTDINNT
jgi:hypothetical protein